MDKGSVQLADDKAIRIIALPRICVESQGHAHNYDHITRVIHGRIRVSFNDGREPIELGPGETILVKAEVHHTVKAIEPDTEYACEFSHRDWEGNVVQTYAGNATAYH